MDVHSVLRCVATGTTKLMTFYSVALARSIWLPDDDPRTETCRNILTF